MNVSKKLKEIQGEEMLFLLHKATNDLRSNFDQKFIVSEGLLRASIDLVDLLNSLSLDEKIELKNIIHEMIGETYEQLAEKKIQSGEHQLVAAHFYDLAANEYKQGNKIQKYQESLRLSNKHTVFDKFIEVKVELPKFKVKGENEQEIIDNLLKLYFDNETSIVNEKNIRDGIVSELNKHPLPLAISHQNFSSIGPSSPSYVDPDEIIKKNIKSTILNNILIFEGLISTAALRLEGNNRLTAIGICDYIDSLKVLSYETSFLLKQGVVYHYAKDYVASIHTLVPQIESVLRRLLELKNLGYFKRKHRSLMFRELGGLLDLKELINILGENIIRYLKIKFSDNDGINLRNSVAHGFLEPGEFNHRNSFSIIYLIIVVLKISLGNTKICQI